MMDEKKANALSNDTEYDFKIMQAMIRKNMVNLTSKSGGKTTIEIIVLFCLNFFFLSFNKINIRTRTSV